MIKALFICIISLTSVTTAFGTMQLPDYIIIEKTTNKLETNPLEIYFEKNPNQRPKNDGRPTNCWRGYVATFEIREGELWINKIEINKGNKKVDVVNKVFPKMKDRKLIWYNKTLIIPSGEIIHFVPMGYGSTYERYRIVQISSGSVVKDIKLTGKEFIRYRKEQFEKYKLTKKYNDSMKSLLKSNTSEDQNDTESLIMSFDSEYYLSENSDFTPQGNDHEQQLIFAPISTNEWRVFLGDVLNTKPFNRAKLFALVRSSTNKLAVELKTIEKGQPITTSIGIFAYSLVKHVAEDNREKDKNWKDIYKYAVDLRKQLSEYYDVKVLDKSFSNLIEVLETTDRDAYFVALENLPTNTKEIIKLKDIEFDAGDVRKQLIEACEKNSYNNCVLGESGSMNMGKYTYGNIETTSSTYSNVEVGTSGELLKFHLYADGAPARFETLAELLTSKYGNAFIVNDEPEKDPSGRPYKRQHFFWKDSRGTIVEIDTIYSASLFNKFYINMGQITIMTKSYINQWEKDSKIKVKFDIEKLERKRSKDLSNL